MNLKTSNSALLKALLLLFLLNSLSLYFYFRPISDSPSPPAQPALSWEKHPHLREPRRSILRRHKRWPILPSYLPWTQNPHVPSHSCEAYFGNGFTERVDILPRDGTGESWFRCFYSETLRSSVCEGGGLRMVPQRIRVSRGGEKLEEVIGRSESDELPKFEGGAFEVAAGGGEVEVRPGMKLVSGDLLDRYVSEGDVERHTMRELIRSIHVVGAGDLHCDQHTFLLQWIEDPTLLVTRYEYANMFHTVTDWYSAYVSSRVTGLPYRPRLVFVDGHCSSPLEQTWRALFSGLRYAKSFSGSVCFRHAIISPLGYETPLFRGLTEKINCSGASAHDLWQNPDDRKTARISEFGEMIRSAFGFPVNEPRIEKPVSGHNILFVRREDYLAHPRHMGKVESRLSNEQEVFDSIQKWAQGISDCKINVVNGLFAHIHMKEQVQAIQEASVIIGAHGAGLTHIVSALPNTVILEIIAIEYRRPHFALIAQWKGLEYHAIKLQGSYATPNVVIEKLSRIVTSLGC